MANKSSSHYFKENRTMNNEFFPTRMSNIDEFFQGRLIGEEQNDE